MTSDSLRQIHHTVDVYDAGQSVWHILRHRLCASDAYLRHAKYIEGAVLVDGTPSRCDATALAGQTVSLVVSDYLEPHESSIDPELGPLDIVYEDDDLLVVNKPADSVVHPSPGHWEHTLGNYVVGYLQQKQAAIDLHSVNRLDIGTTGLVVFATSGYVQERLQAQMHSLSFVRKYLAVCENPGLAPSGMVKAPIERKTSAPSSFGVGEGGKPAVTHYETIGAIPGPEGELSLVQLVLETGRTHQIRVHMSHIGHPLVGDSLYGSRIAFNRPALHSWTLELDHPVTKEHLTLEAPVPQDMLDLMGAVRPR